jgi:hypothetical protein
MTKIKGARSLRLLVGIVMGIGLSGAAAAQSALTFSGTVFPVTSVGAPATQNITVTISSSSTVSFQSITLAPGFGDYTIGTVAQGNCVTGGVTFSGGTTCTIPITFTPSLPGDASSPEPISRSAPLLITDTENGMPMKYAVGLTGSGTNPLLVVTPGLISDRVGNDQAPAASQTGFGGDGGTSSGAVFNGPRGMTLDAAGNIYIADTGNCVIRRIDNISRVVSTVAGVIPSPAVHCGAGTDGVAATSSMLQTPVGIALDAAGNLYIADSGNNAIREVSAATGLISTVAGTLGTAGFSGDGAAANAALLTGPLGVAVDGAGDIFIADTGNFAVREVAASTGLISTVAGTGGQQGTTGILGAYGPATAFLLMGPQAVAVDGAGNLYVADTDGYVLQVNAVSQNINPLVPPYYSSFPMSVAVDASGNAYYTIAGDCNVYMNFGQNIYATPITVGGNGTCGTGGDGGLSTAAGLNTPQDVVPDGSGNLYILEAEGVRYIDDSGSSPNLIANFGSVNIGVTSATQTFTFSNGDAQAPAGGTVNPNGLYFTAPSPAAPFAPGNPAGEENCFGSNFNLSAGSYCGAAVTFTPQTDGPATGSFSADIYGAPFATVHLTGTGTGALPTATLTGGPLTFTVEVHHSATASQSLTLTNTSTTTPLSISSITFANMYMANYVSGFSETDNCGTTLAPGKSCTIMVSFATGSVGTFQQTLTVADNTTAGSQSVALTGTSTESLATLTPTAAVTFPSTPVGTTSAAQTFVLSNTGAAPLVISSISFTSTNPNAFVVNSSACGTMLAAGSTATPTTCNILVYFQPPSSGTFTATLNLADDSGGQYPGVTVSQTVPLSGTAPALVQKSTFAIGNTTFASTPVGQTITQTVTLTLGSAGIILKSIALPPGFTDYTLGTITGCKIDGVTANSLGTVCSIPVTFTPLQPGYARNAPLLVTTIESALPVPYAFGFHGTATGPVAVMTGIIGPSVAAQGSGPSNNPGTVLGGMGGLATMADIGQLSDMAIDTAGNEYVADGGFGYIYKVNLAGIINVYAGKAGYGYSKPLSGDGGPAIGAALGAPSVIAIDPADNVYFGDSDSSGDVVIRRIDFATGNISTVVGGGSGCVAKIDTFGDGCLGTQVNLTKDSGGTVAGLIFDSAGNLYFDSTGGFAIHKMNATTGIVSVYAGTAGSTEGTGADNGPAIGAAVSPGPMTLDSLGNMFVVDNYIKVREITAAGTISTISGANSKGYEDAYYCTPFPLDPAPDPSTGNGGPAAAATFCGVTGITVDLANDIYLVDEEANQVRRIDAGTGIIAAVTGLNSIYEEVDYGDYTEQYGNNDGSAAAARLNHPIDVRLDGAGNLYLVEAYNARMINISQAALDFTPNFNPNPPYGRFAANVGSSTGPLGVTVLNAGNGGALTFQTPYTNAPLYGITTDDYTRDTLAADCISTGSIAPGIECGVNIDFTPTVVGSPVPGTETLNDNAATPTQTVTLIGFSQPPTAQVTLLPSLLNFSSTLNTASPSQSFTLTNTTTGTLTITGITFAGPNAAAFTQTTSTCGATLAANASCQIAVIFTPTTNAQALAQITVTYSQTVSGYTYSSTNTANLVGQVGVAAAQLGPTQLSNAINFGQQQVGITSAVMTTTLYSTGTAPLSISSIAIGGTDAGQFAISSSTCGTSLAPQTSCTISLTFTPLSNSPGTPPVPFSAAVIVTDNAPSTTQSASLSGIGYGGTVGQTITFIAASPVTFGVAPITLSATATSGLAVTFSVLSGPGTVTPSGVLTVTGAGTIVVAANQSGGNGFGAAPQVTQSIVVNKATPVVAWSAPAAISYGTALSANQLDATFTGVGGATLAGTPLYSPAAGAVPLAGTQTLSVTFTPTDTADYNAATGSVSLTVTSVAATLTWATPVPIVYGVPLSGTQLDAAATGAGNTMLAGSFVYTPAAGVYLAPGAQPLKVVFTPTDLTDYTAQNGAVTLTVNKASAAVSGPAIQPVGVTNGQSGTVPVTVAGQYSGAGIATPGGTVNYTIVNGAGATVASGPLTLVASAATIPVANTLAPGSYTINVTYGGDGNYAIPATPTTIAVQIGQIQTTINWPQPAAIVYGTNLSGVLNASALNGSTPVPGTLVYKATPAGGTASVVTGTTVLVAGSYTLGVTFTPTDTATYTSATGAVTLTVQKATPGVAVTSSANPVFAQSAVTLTATVSSAISVPAGTLSFFDGTTLLSTGTLSGGVATVVVSTLAVGTHSITAAYSGDSNFVTLTSAVISQTVADFGVTAPATATGALGGTATYSLTFTPVGATTFPAAVSLTASGLPTGATYTLTPSSIASGASATNVTMTIQVPKQLAALDHSKGFGPGLATVTLALLLLPLSRRMRRSGNRLRRLMAVALLLLAGAGALSAVTGCGYSTGYFGQQGGSFAVTVTGTSGALTHSATTTLTVQ